MSNKKAVAGMIAVLIVLSSCTVRQPFNLVLLPDTQHYSASYPEIFRAQTEWIVDHSDSIAFVLHQGDITHNNNEEQWKNATEALFLMDHKVPYTFVQGNHDLHRPGFRVATLFNQYLPYEKYSRMNGFGGAFEEKRMDNVWHAFKAGGLDWLILSLEFGPRDKVLDWAGKIVKAHPKHKVIVNTHTYMYTDDTRQSHEEGDKWAPQAWGIVKGTGEETPNDGEMMWEKFVGRYPNILLVFSGHVLNDGAGRLTSVGVNGNKVYQMVANYQGGVEGSVKGGNGYLRILNIDPRGKRISVKTYSPYLDEYKSDADHQFVLEDVDL